MRGKTESEEQVFKQKNKLLIPLQICASKKCLKWGRGAPNRDAVLKLIIIRQSGRLKWRALTITHPRQLGPNHIHRRQSSSRPQAIDEALGGHIDGYGPARRFLSRHNPLCTRGKFARR